MFSLKLFGGVALFGDAGPAAGPSVQRRRLALLSLLAAAPDGGISRDKLVGYLWPETGSDQARRFLADSIYTLRKALGQEAILSVGDNLRLNAAVIRSDLGEFREALARGDRQAAVALYDGPFLDGFFVPGVPEFEHWVDAERERCARAYAYALEMLAGEAEQTGEPGGAAEWWRRLAVHDPFSSRVALRLMHALEAAGDPGGALQHARVHESLMRDVLEVEPDAEVSALAERLRTPAAAPAASAAGSASETQADAAAATPSPAVVELRDAGARRGGRRKLTWAAGLAFGVTVVGAAVLVGDIQVPKNTRVLVAVFYNQTGDPALDPLGLMAADWIGRGLLETGSVEVVVPGTAAATRGNGDIIRAQARTARAGTVVSGAYYRDGDALHLQVKVSDWRGRLLHTLEPLSVPVDSATAGVELLRQRVAAVLAARFDWKHELREITTSSRPPTYAAYAAYVEGINRFGEFEHATERFAQAWALDSTFYSARLFYILANTQAGRLARVDSMIQALVPYRDGFSPFERAFLERAQADLAGDREAALRAARRMTELAPGSQFIIGHAAHAVWTNRPREAVNAFRRLDPKLGVIQGHAGEEFLTAARHMLGEHREELQRARQARLRHPDLITFWWEVRALAALGRVTEVERLLEESLALPPHRALTAGELLRHTAAELRAHGHADAAARTLEQALAWYGSRPAEEQRRHRPAVVRTLYDAERWAEARALLDELAEEQPQGTAVLGYLGALAARRGDHAEAERISGALASSAQPYLRGAHTLWRARIAAQLGEREQAVQLLRKAFEEGHTHGPWLHTDADLEPLRGLSSFRALARPKG